MKKRGVKMRKKVIFSFLLTIIVLMLVDAIAFAESNANKTGELITFEGKANMIERSWKGQSTHGNYQNNTNSCASCHKTHTAEPSSNGASNLLFKNGTSAVCESCHDGSVQGGGDLNGHNLNAGTFGSGQDQNTGASVHSVREGELLSSAPGGDKLGSSNNEWGNALSCGSCHNPHGSNSEFMLSTSIIGETDYTQSTTHVYPEGGIPVNYTTEYVLGYVTVNAAEPFNSGYYSELNLVNNSKALMTYWWDLKQDQYVLDYPLWNVGADNMDPKIKNPSGYTVDYKHGFAYGTNLLSTIPVGTELTNVTFGISVQPWRYPSDAVPTELSLKIDNRSYFDTTSQHYNAGSGRQLTKFCAQCHTDYVSYGHTYVTGIYTQASRHRTYDDAFSCSRCHFAHGTDMYMMRDASGKSIVDLISAGMSQGDAEDYMVDINNSSALKRYTGMSVCFSCHGSSSKVSSDIESSENYAAQNEFKAGEKLVVPF
jgi:cytochrome c553